MTKVMRGELSERGLNWIAATIGDLACDVAERLLLADSTGSRMSASNARSDRDRSRFPLLGVL